MGRDVKFLIRKIENEVTECLTATDIKSLLIAVSGGADSVALLTACSRIANRIGLRIEAVNCNFHLRGEESDRDSEFVNQLCKSLGIKLHSLDYDVEGYLKIHPDVSIEMACRDLRYSDFYRIMEEQCLDRIAIAHNADDDIETMMLNMLRGSGSRGLKGMLKDNGRIIRPLLGISRKEIEKYLEGLGGNFITDSSNLTSEYRRNFIRREILPIFESQWVGARKSLSKTVNILKEESKIIEEYYQTKLKALCPDEFTLRVYDDAMSSGIILRFLEPFGGNTEIVESIMEAINQKFTERTWYLSDRYQAILERDRLIVIDNEEIETEPIFEWTEISLTPEKFTEIIKNPDHNSVYLPSDQTAYEIRTQQTGDRISPLGMKGTRLVSDVISDAKLSHLTKSQVRVLIRKADNEIIWIAGLKRSRHDLISPTAKVCYKLSKI